MAEDFEHEDGGRPRGAHFKGADSGAGTRAPRPAAPRRDRPASPDETTAFLISAGVDPSRLTSAAAPAEEGFRAPAVASPEETAAFMIASQYDSPASAGFNAPRPDESAQFALVGEDEPDALPRARARRRPMAATRTGSRRTTRPMPTSAAPPRS